MQNAHKGHFHNTFIALHMYKFQKVQKRKTFIFQFGNFGNFQNRPKSAKMAQNRLAGLKIDLRGPKSLERSKISLERSKNLSKSLIFTAPTSVKLDQIYRIWP